MKLFFLSINLDTIKIYYYIAVTNFKNYQMDIRIKITTSESEKLDLPLDLVNYMSTIKMLVGGEEKFLGNIYHESEKELDNIRKYFEAMPKAFAFVEYYGKLERTEVSDKENLVKVHEKLTELFDELKALI